MRNFYGLILWGLAAVVLGGCLSLPSKNVSQGTPASSSSAQDTPVAAQSSGVQAVQDMFDHEPRLNHIQLHPDSKATIEVFNFGPDGVRFQTKTFGMKRNDLSRDYETLVLTRFKDGTQKVFGTSWPAADSRAFKDSAHSYRDVDRFMVVLNRGRVSGSTGKLIGKAILVEFSDVVVVNK